MTHWFSYPATKPAANDDPDLPAHYLVTLDEDGIRTVDVAVWLGDVFASKEENVFTAIDVRVIAWAVMPESYSG
jgi:hypothetical protein